MPRLTEEKRPMRTGTCAGMMLAVGLMLALPATRMDAEEITPAPVIKIGIANSMFRDTPPSLIGLLSRPLKALMQAETGVSGDLQLAGDAAALAQKLKENKVQLGVFHGH